MPEHTPNRIDAASLAARFATRDDWALIDVRDPVAYERRHLFTATSVPRQRIEQRIGTLVRDRATPIVVYDDGSGRAERAASTLACHGYGNVAVLEGGLAGVAGTGLRVVSGTNVPSKLFGEEVQHGHDVPSISAATLAEWRAAGRDFVLCDVRTPEEHGISCVPGAIGAPSFAIALAVADLAAAHETVVVTCAGRTRSIIGARTLRELGHDNVVALENGLMGWRLAGRAVEEGARQTVAAPSAASVAAAQRASRRLADEAGVARIDAQALRAMLESTGTNGYAFDVRPVRDYVAGHIPGTVALPGGQAIQRTDDFVAIRAAPIVLVDAHGVEANLTGTWLRRMGCTRVAVLEGGIDAWRATGAALVRGREREAALGWDEAVAAVRLASPFDAERQRAQGIVLDVDTSRRFQEGHVPGAVWAPRGDLETSMASLAPSQAIPLLVTCGTGVQSVYAAAALQTAGYRDVTVLRGGTRAWAADGLPLEAAVLPPQDDELLPPYRRGLQAMRDYIDWEKMLVGADVHGATGDTTRKERLP